MHGVVAQHENARRLVVLVNLRSTRDKKSGLGTMPGKKMRKKMLLLSHQGDGLPVVHWEDEQLLEGPAAVPVGLYPACVARPCRFG